MNEKIDHFVIIIVSEWKVPGVGLIIHRRRHAFLCRQIRALPAKISIFIQQSFVFQLPARAEEPRKKYSFFALIFYPCRGVLALAYI